MWVKSFIFFKNFSLYIQFQLVTYVPLFPRLLLFGPFKLAWRNGAWIPGFPWPRPKFSGTRRGQGEALQKYRGIFGDGDGLNFGVFWGFIPENPQKIIGETLGTGIGSSLGIYWGFPTKKPQFSGIPQKSLSLWIMNIVTCIKVLYQGDRGH